MSLSPEVKARRREGISATDAAPILGLSPWKSPAEVWLEKKKPELVEMKENKFLYWGTRHEQTIAEEYSKVTGQNLKPSPLLYNAKIKWMMCSPDRIILPSDKKGLECKTANERMSYLWGPAGTDRVPQEYLIQCQHSMMTTNIHEWDLAVLIGGCDFRIYHIFRDKELMRLMYQQEEEFWRRFISGSETPECDWGKSITEFVRKKYPQHKDGQKYSVDDNGDEVIKKSILDLIDARSSLSSTKKIEDTQKALIQSYMADSEVMDWIEKGVHITWRNIKDSVNVDWKKIIEELLPHVSLPADEKKKLIDRYTTTKAGTRRFVFKSQDGDEDDE